MRFLIACLVAVLAFATAASVAPDVSNYTYEQFLAEYHPMLSAAAPCPIRKANFEANLARIQEHNAQKRSWFMAPNAYMDWTEAEFLAKFTTKRSDVRPHRLRTRNDFAPIWFNKDRTPVPASKPLKDIPASVDYSDKVNVLNQGSCGSCWAFATATTLNARALIETGKEVSVSTQQITSCTPNPRHCGGTGGCKGATFQIAAEYIAGEEFLTTEDAYPYRSGSTQQTGTCKFDAGSMPPALTISGYMDLPKNDKEALLREIATSGPVAVSVAASSFFLYGGGIFDGCTNGGKSGGDNDGDINHAVTAVGYDLENGFLTIANSWGASWGEKGFIRLRMYDNEPKSMDKDPFAGAACEGDSSEPYAVIGECGVFSDSSYPIGIKVLQ